MKYCSILTILLFAFQTYAQEVKTVINQNLDNYVLRRASEDTSNFRTKEIYSVRNYKVVTRGKPSANVKIFNGKPFSLTAYTEYMPDGRKRYKKYPYSTIERTEQYHYDANSGNLVLIEATEDNAKERQHDRYFSWLFYNQKGDLTENFDYRLYSSGRFIYESYTSYNFEYLKDETRVKVTSYSSDTIAGLVQSYIFSKISLIKAKPEYQSKWQKFKMINGVYQPVETRGYIFKDRNVDFTYNQNGMILSEIWHKPTGDLENKTEYSYSRDNKESVEQRYDLLGTRKSSRTVRKYDKFNNLIFEETTEASGNPLGHRITEYVYDEKGNWLEKRTYDQAVEKGVYGQKKLLLHERREIEYYKQGQNPRVLTLPVFPQKAKDVKNKIPQWSVGAAKRKQARKDEEDLY